MHQSERDCVIDRIRFFPISGNHWTVSIEFTALSRNASTDANLSVFRQVMKYAGREAGMIRAEKSKRIRSNSNEYVILKQRSGALRSTKLRVAVVICFASIDIFGEHYPHSLRLAVCFISRHFHLCFSAASRPVRDIGVVSHLLKSRALPLSESACPHREGRGDVKSHLKNCAEKKLSSS